MTDQIFFDTDCLACFLWVNRESLLLQLYKERIYVPSQVCLEIKPVHYLRQKIDTSIKSRDYIVPQMVLDSKEGKLYYQFTQQPEKGMKILGKGEAAALALAITYNAILASNNLKDIRLYVEKYKVINLTTGAILDEDYATFFL
jgi:predicted nucleic acid-binding protein